MAGLFNKAKATAAAAPKATKKKETMWLVPAGSKEAVAVKELVDLTRQAKAVEAKMGVYKGTLKDFGETNYVGDYVKAGVSPETPMTIQTPDGDKVTFVVQDRSAQYGVKDDQKQALIDLLGEDAAGEMLFEETSFGFNRDILALPGVMEVVEKALEGAIKKLVDTNTLTEEQTGELLDVKVKTAFKPGTLDRLVLIAGKDTTKVGQLLEIMGSSATRYVKT
jgi:hypothetical protein